MTVGINHILIFLACVIFIAGLLLIYIRSRVLYIRGIKFDILVVGTRIFPLILTLLFYRSKLRTVGVTLENSSWSLFLGICVGTSSIMIEYFLLHVKLLVRREFLSSLPPIGFTHLVHRLSGCLFLFPVSEEILYRGYIQMSLMPVLGSFSIIVSTLLFIMQHYLDLQTRALYPNWRNKIFLFYVTITWGLITYVTGSLLGAIIAHIMTNFMYAIYQLKRYVMSR